MKKSIKIKQKVLLLYKKVLQFNIKFYLFLKSIVIKQKILLLKKKVLQVFFKQLFLTGLRLLKLENHLKSQVASELLKVTKKF